MNFLTSDTHYNHSSIIRLSGRPFLKADGTPDVEAMNETLIERHNSVVRPNDDVFHLGDFSFREKHPDDAYRILERLNGRFHFIKGNHDEWLTKPHDKIVWVKDYYELRHDKQRFVLSHYPMLTWHGVHKGACMLHGHAHGNVNQWNVGVRRLDVGVDTNNFTPLEIGAIATLLNAVDPKPAEGYHPG